MYFLNKYQKKSRHQQGEEESDLIHIRTPDFGGQMRGKENLERLLNILFILISKKPETSVATKEP